MVPIMGFECRNLELTAWHPGPGFTVVSESGKKTFEDVDLGEASMQRTNSNVL